MLSVSDLALRIEGSYSFSADFSNSGTKYCLICGGGGAIDDCNNTPASSYQLRRSQHVKLLPNALEGLIRLLGCGSSDRNFEIRLKSANYCQKCAHDLEEVYCILEQLEGIKKTVIRKVRASHSYVKHSDQQWRQQQELRAEILSKANSKAGKRRNIEVPDYDLDLELEPQPTQNESKRLRLLPIARDLLAPDPLWLAAPDLVEVKIEAETDEKDEPEQDQDPLGNIPVLRTAPAPMEDAPAVNQSLGPIANGEIKTRQWSPPRRLRRKRGSLRLHQPKNARKTKLAGKGVPLNEGSVPIVHHVMVRVPADRRSESAPAVRKDPPRVPEPKVAPVPPQPAANGQLEVFICRKCDHVSTSRSEYFSHQRSCQFLCKVCGEPMANTAALKAHKLATHPDVQQGRGICAVCLAHSADLEFHYVTKHQTQFTCGFCGLSEFDSFLEYNHHRTTHPELQLPPVKCEECGRIFKKNRNLLDHITIFHQRQHPFRCDRPGCTFGSRAAACLRNHIRTAHEGHMPFQCDICSHHFKTQQLFRLHRLRHEGKEPHKKVCPEDGCGKAFQTLGKFRDHMAAVHGQGGGHHICDVCGKEFKVFNYLYIHLRSHETPEEKMARRLRAEQAREERRRSGAPILVAKGRPRTRPTSDAQRRQQGKNQELGFQPDTTDAERGSENQARAPPSADPDPRSAD